MDAALSSNTALLLATADLAMTRSLLAAMNTTIPGKANPNATGVVGSSSSSARGGHVTPEVEIEPRRRIDPEPRIEPRRVYRPESTEPWQATVTEPAELPREKDTVQMPLPTPWQMLVRDRVWNREMVPETKPIAPPRPMRPQTSGAMLDTFC